MPKISEHRSDRWTVAIAIALLSTLVLAAPALADQGNAGGNSDASAVCENGGYENWTDAAGNAFRNAGACVRYTARGGTLRPVVVVVSPFSVSYTKTGANGFVATLTGTGLEPSSGVDLILTWGGDPLFVGGVADTDGAITFPVSSVCFSLGSPLTAVGAAGTVVGGDHTEYPLELPGPAICA